MPTAVVAIGGNSLVRPGERGWFDEQRRNLLATCEGIAAVIAAGYRVVVTHGNGPQVGDALLRSELAASQVELMPLDACVAETQGSIGYLLQQSLPEALQRHGVRRPVVTVVTQVLVSPRDPAFRSPTKPVGPFYAPEEADRRRASLGWRLVEDAHRGYRRVVASPRPKEIIELPTIQAALAGGALVIACGGGGIPVIYRRDRLVGIDAVVDKDLTSSLLASDLEAELFLISTSVDCVALNYGAPGERPLENLSASEARRYLREGQFPPGSMGPKIEAALGYLERGGKLVIITSPERIAEALHGLAGTASPSASQLSVCPCPRRRVIPLWRFNIIYRYRNRVSARRRDEDSQQEERSQSVKLPPHRGALIFIHAQGLEVRSVLCPAGQPLLPNQRPEADEVYTRSAQSKGTL